MPISKSQTNSNLQIPNTHRVPGKQWRKWPEGAHSVFNEVFFTMRNNGPVVMPPGLRKLPDHLLHVIAWNAAWVAADAAMKWTGEKWTGGRGDKGSEGKKLAVVFS